jgi:hypothetical protein
LFLLCSLGIGLVITGVLVGITLVVSKMISWLVIFWRKKKNHAYSPFFGLWKLWQGFTIKKIFLSILLFSLLLNGFLFSIFSASILRIRAEWGTEGAQLITWITPKSEVEFDQSLENLSTVKGYRKTLDIASYRNNTEPNHLFFNNTRPYSYELLRIHGINHSSYFKFFTDWRLDNWLSEGSLDDFNNRSIYITKAAQDDLLGLSIGDLLYFDVANRTIDVEIRGIIDRWPGVTSYSPETTDMLSSIVMDYSTLTLLRSLSGVSAYSFVYCIYTDLEDISSTVQSVAEIQIALDDFAWIGYLDPLIYTGLWKVFVYPSLIEFQLMVFLLGAIYLIVSMKNKLASNEALALGLLAMEKKYYPTFMGIKIVEFAIGSILALALYPLLYLITYLYYFLNPERIDVTLLSYAKISPQVITNAIIVYCLFLGILLIQQVVDLIRFSKLDLSMMYRHPE